MRNVLIRRGTQEYGPYALDVTLQYLASGHFRPDDLAWTEGFEDWIRLEELVSRIGESRASAAPAQSVASSHGAKVTPLPLPPRRETPGLEPPPPPPPPSSSSQPPPPPPPPPPGSETESGSWVQRAADRVSAISGVEKIRGFSLAELLSETFKRRSPEEIERYFVVGTTATTPNLRDVDTNWPKPWMFARALVSAWLLYAGLLFCLHVFSNPRLLPGLMVVGSFVVPLAALIFFLEMNAPRNVSVYLLTRFILAGGVLSIAISLALYNVTAGLGALLGPPIAGLVEETGKLATVIFLTRKMSGPRYRYQLNGLLFGAAVGTGFAALESAGYAFERLLEDGALAMEDSIHARGMLSPFGHVIWTALAAAALWRVKGVRRFKLEMLADQRFWRVFALVTVLHALWDTPFLLPPFWWLKYVVLGAVGWVTVIGMVQEGLSQLRAEQRQAAGTVG